MKLCTECSADSQDHESLPRILRHTFSGEAGQRPKKKAKKPNKPVIKKLKEQVKVHSKMRMKI